MKIFSAVPLLKGLIATFFLALPASVAFAQTSVSNNPVPFVTIQATVAQGTWTGGRAQFTIFRYGNGAPALNVYCCISGTASNGVDYQTIGNFVSLGAGVWSNNIVIQPINLGQTDTKTVTIDLCPSPALNPVNYSIGSPSNATVYLTPGTASNLPPVVKMVSPTNGAVFYTPIDISLVAQAGETAGTGGTISNVEFFAGTTDLGRGSPVVLDPPGENGVTGLVYFLNWQNVPTNLYSLTAVAMASDGLASTSAPVNVTVLTGPAPTNPPPVVRITSPPNDAVFRAPVHIPIYAFAADPGGVANVEFFAGTNSLGYGQHVTAVPPPLPPGPVQPPILIYTPTNYWELVWTNPPAGTNLALTAQATAHNDGATTVSVPVYISILPSPPPPTNRPSVVSIVATDPVAIKGTNCWPWPGLAAPVATWSNWFTPNATYRIFTNCGPKNATFTVFRSGATNDSLEVDYSIAGTATNGIDYVALPGTVTILAGDSCAAINVVPLDDGPPDITSTVVLRLSASTNYILGYPRAAAAIILDSQSPRPVTGLMPGPVFHLTATGPEGAWFDVETSSDMIHWTPICTNQVVNGTIDFVDPEVPTNPALFYRTEPEAGSPPQ